MAPLFAKVLLWLGLFQCHAYKFSERHANQSTVNATKPMPLYEELAASLPLVLQNLTNYSGLINDKGAPPNPNITHHFGELASDLAMLSDKVSGFYYVLHEMLPDGSGPFLCPVDKQSHIKECLLIATCLLEYHVPEQIELAAYTTYMEMTQRFIDVGWEALKNGLLMEEPTPVLNMDATAPEKYQCDQLKHIELHPALLQVDESDGATLAMSSAVVQASKSSFQILEQHQVGSSVDATILKLHELWMPICKHLDCDHSSFWDLHYASYGQTASLLQVKSGYAARRAMRKEIQHRVKLEKRVSQFVSENYEYYSILYNETHYPPGRRFIDSSLIQASSRAARTNLLGQGRESMMRHVMPFMKEIATKDENRAIRLFDQVEFRKFQQRKYQHKAVSLLQEEEEQQEEDHAVFEAGEDEDSSDDEEEDEDAEEGEHEDEAEDAEDADAEDAPVTVEGMEVDAVPATLLGLDDHVEESDSSEGGRRRRRRRRRNRRRWIGGRRRSRRRRRIFDIVAKIVEDVVEFMENLMSCAGQAVEFASTGYDFEVAPGAVSLSLGLSAGVRQALEDLISHRSPRFAISLDFGFAVGITKKLAWLGVGLGGSLSCDTSGDCGAYVTVASLVTINPPVTSAFCPMGPTWGAATCAHSFGGGISTMCCTMGMSGGSNDCR